MSWRELALRRVDGQRALRRATEAERDLAVRRIDGSDLWKLQTSQGAIQCLQIHTSLLLWLMSGYACTDTLPLTKTEPLGSTDLGGLPLPRG